LVYGFEILNKIAQSTSQRQTEIY